MALTKDNLIALIALQETDGALDKQKAAIEKIPGEIDVLKAELDKEKARTGEAKTRTITLEKKKKEKELELAGKEESAKKHGAQLNSVKTNEAFKALQHEIEAAKAEGSAIETEILEIMEEIDRSRKEEKVSATELAGIEKQIGGEIQALKAKLSHAKGEFEGGKAARDAKAAPIPPEAMRVYDHVRSRGKLNAVVAIDGDRCSACNITLAPQVIVEATKSKQLVTCESCQRIIYRPESLVAKTI